MLSRNMILGIRGHSSVRNKYFAEIDFIYGGYLNGYFNRKASYETQPEPENVKSNILKTYESKVNLLKSQMYATLNFYEQYIGIEEVRAAQNKVIQLQDKFSIAQEKRRDISFKLNELKQKTKFISEELNYVSKGDDKFISLITKEHELLKEEKNLRELFKLYENEERELFSLLTAAVKESHEKERIQANKSKYLSVIASIFGTLVGVIGSGIINHKKMSKLDEVPRICESFKNEFLQLKDKNSEEVKRLLAEVSRLSREVESLNKFNTSQKGETETTDANNGFWTNMASLSLIYVVCKVVTGGFF